MVVPRRRAFSYLRCSDPTQAAGNTFKRQIELRDLFVAKMNWDLDTELVFEDKGVSAWTGANLKRDLGRFLRYVKRGLVPPGSVLVLENIDRFSRRDPMEAMSEVQDLFKKGIAIASVHGEQVFEASSDPMKNMVTAMQLLVLLAQANQESTKKSERGKDNWARKRRNAAKVPMTKSTPAWIKLVDEERDAQGRLVGGRYVLDPERAPVVKRIFKLAADGYGHARIVQILTRDGVRPFGKVPWELGYVGRILRNRAAIGEFQPKRTEGTRAVPDGEPIPNYFPAVVTEAEFYKARVAVEGRNQAPGRVGNGVANCLSGLVKDAVTHDGYYHYKYKDPTGKVRRYLRPNMCRKGGSGAGMVPFEPFERAVLGLLYEMTADDVTDAGADYRRDLDEADARVAKLKDKHARTNKRYKEADTEAKEIAALNLLAEVGQDLRAAEEAAEHLRMRLAGEAGHALKETQTILESLDGVTGEELEERRTKVRQLMKEMVSEIWVLTTLTDPSRPRSGYRLHHFQLVFHNGKLRRGLLAPAHPSEFGSWRACGIDLRDKKEVRAYLRNDPNRAPDLVG